MQQAPYQTHEPAGSYGTHPAIPRLDQQTPVHQSVLYCKWNEINTSTCPIRIGRVIKHKLGRAIIRDIINEESLISELCRDLHCIRGPVRATRLFNNDSHVDGEAIGVSLGLGLFRLNGTILALKVHIILLLATLVERIDAEEHSDLFILEFSR